MRIPRYVVAIHGIGLVVALVGGALLWASLHKTATTNAHFICTFGSAISAEPLKPRNAETAKEFKQRVKVTKAFVAELEGELDDCDQPTVIVVSEKGKEKLSKGERHRPARRKGGGRQQGSPPSQQPAPGNGGSGGNIGGGGTQPPPDNPPPPSDDRNALDEVCDVTDSILPLPAVC